MSIGITHDEWRAALVEAQGGPCDPTAITSREFEKISGLKATRAREVLKQLVDAGKARRTFKLVDGRRLPAYKLLVKGKK